MPRRAHLLLSLCFGISACDGGGPSGSTDGGTASPDQAGGDATACDALLARVTEAYPEATSLGACDGETAATLAASLMNLDGLTIDNQGASMTPCISVACSDTYAYVAANALPHYDFVATTPNALVERELLYRIPLTTTAHPSAGVVDAESIDGCSDAYAQYLDDSAVATGNEPSGLCSLGADTLISDVEGGETRVYQEIPCFDATAFVIAGSPTYGPNEAATPDPYGNPGYNYPNDTSDDYGTGAALDLCGGHTAAAMHYHAVIEACFERDDEGAPARSYASATAGWDLEAAMTADCAEPSGIVGWAPDGYPIEGPCVCVSRGTDGSCTEVRRARSGWSYAGLGSWGDDAGEAAALGVEGATCDDDSDCCAGAGCDFSCSVTVAPTGVGTETEVGKRCVLVDYSWCTHRYARRDDKVPDGASYVYMDRCNGYDGPDGYAYHATLTFPFLTGCFRGAVGTYAVDLANDAGGGGGGGGGNPPACSATLTTMCCGDGICGGPETAVNCADDCA